MLHECSKYTAMLQKKHPSCLKQLRKNFFSPRYKNNQHRKITVRKQKLVDLQIKIKIFLKIKNIYCHDKHKMKCCLPCVKETTIHTRKA